jgi:peptidoglycan/LPS O-acetylase OafA/YrhL
MHVQEPPRLVESRGVPLAAKAVGGRLASVNPHDAYLGTRFFSSLNGIRCLCCLAVIKEHTHWDVGGPRLGNLGFLGVDLFFAISGFLIVTLLIRERERRGTVSLRKFYARRTFRIFPIYFLLIATVFLVYLAISPWAPNSLRSLLWTFPVLMTYTQDLILIPTGNFFNCWSLAMEEQFYLFWPTVEKYSSRLGWCVILAAMLLVNQGMNFGLFDGLIGRIYGNASAATLPVFQVTFTPILLGVALAYLLHNRRAYAIVYRLVGARWSVFVCVGILVAICEVAPGKLNGWPRLMIQLSLVAVLASLVVREDHYARRILACAPMARLGVISYGIYLYHTWVIWVLTMAVHRLGFSLVSPSLMFLLVTAMTVLVAELSFRLIEQPLLHVKERYSS